MAMVQITSEISIELDEVLDGVAKLDTPELERFLSQVSILLAQPKAPSLPQREAELLQKINQGLPTVLQQRYDELSAKLKADTITPGEHQELLQLIDKIELADAERLQHLIELARLRNTSLDELMDQLSIHPPPAHV
jgi:hypothetical protein